ncbi:hypothetical protein MRX96_051358, partial [Rhipicephalus microplus]
TPKQKRQTSKTTNYRQPLQLIQATPLKKHNDLQRPGIKTPDIEVSAFEVEVFMTARCLPWPPSSATLLTVLSSELLLQTTLLPAVADQALVNFVLQNGRQVVGEPASTREVRIHRAPCLRDSERLTVLAWQDLGRGLLLSENPHLRARFQIVHRRRDERRKVLAWRGRALSGYRLPSDDLGRGLLLSENPHLRARFQIVHRRRDERRKVLAWRGRALSGYRLPSDGSFTRPLTPAAATSFPHRTSTRRRLRHHRDATSPQPPGPQAPPRETID